MRAVIQRVTYACVRVDGEIAGEIGRGLCILLGVVEGDTAAEAELLAAKTAKLRVFEDEDEKMNRSLTDIGGGALVISQFTLCADCRKGNRPSFASSAPPEQANALYGHYAGQLRANGVKDVATGIFAADMAVRIDNDGPVTVVLDTDVYKRSRR